MTPNISCRSLIQIRLQIPRWRTKWRPCKGMAVSQALIFHFKWYSLLHFAVWQLLCWAFLLNKLVVSEQDNSDKLRNKSSIHPDSGRRPKWMSFRVVLTNKGLCARLMPSGPTFISFRSPSSSSARLNGERKKDSGRPIISVRSVFLSRSLSEFLSLSS